MRIWDASKYRKMKYSLEIFRFVRHVLYFAFRVDMDSRDFFVMATRLRLKTLTEQRTIVLNSRYISESFFEFFFFDFIKASINVLMTYNFVQYNLSFLPTVFESCNVYNLKFKLFLFSVVRRN